jgi:type I restriction enzyme M protein
MLEVKRKSDKIFAPLKDSWLIETPEEKVRQEFICQLVNSYGYHLDQMEQEKNLTEYSDRGTGQASADIVIWKSKEDRLKNKNAFLIVECKAEHIKLTEKDYFQGANYARWSGASILVVTNGKEIKVFEILKEELPFSKRPVSDIPHASIINDDEKLQAELLQTTTFKRDEFAKLLLKCHNIIRNNDKLSPEAAFDEISKILFMKIRYERSPKQDEIFSLAQFERQKEAYELIRGKSDESSYIQKLFEDTKDEFKNDDLFEDNEKIKIREKSFEDIVKELQIYNLSNTSDDVKGIAFEQFLGKTFRGELGQFFTPRVIVDFMVELLDPKEGELVCDPTSGSGGFLIKAFEHIRTQISNDIEGQKEKIQKEYFGKKLEKIDDEKISKIVEEKLAELDKELQLSLDKSKVVTRIDKLSKSCIFGTDANPRMARVSKMNMIMHGDGHGGVHHNDGLLNVNGIFENRFDVIVTNPPFGSRVDKDLKIEESDKYKDEAKKAKYLEMYGDDYLNALGQVEKNIGKSLIDLYETGKLSGLTEVLFMERCLRLLKDGGRMGIVLPEGVLNSSNLQKVRDFFEARAKILLIASLPQEIFISSGATVKTSLVFLKKFTQEERATYEAIKTKAETEINALYADELQQLNSALALRGKASLSKEEKKELQNQKKELEEKISIEIKEHIKQEFDYEIPIADIAKAGISSTGGKDENQLPELLEVYTKYRISNNLWTVKA